MSVYRWWPFWALVASFLLIAVQSLEYKCHEEGRFTNPSHCGSYIDCVFDPRAQSLVARNGTCGKGAFHPKYKKCVAMNEVPDCYFRIPKMDSHQSDLNHLCTEGVDFICANCETVVHCMEGEAFASTCSDGDTCHNKNEFSGGVCYPQEIPECVCTQSDTFMDDFYDEQTFYFCHEDLSTTLYRCTEDMIFDEEQQQCVNNLGLPPCNKIGVFAVEDDCTNYYTCIQAERGYVQKKFKCPNKTMYNEITSRCENPCEWSQGEFSCTAEGRYRDVTDCVALFECIDLGDEFRLTKLFCPLDWHWQPSEEGNTGKCVRRGESECEPVTVARCQIPSDWCSDLDDQNDVTDLGIEVDLSNGDDGDLTTSTDPDDLTGGDSTNPSNPDDLTQGDVPNPDDLAGGDITELDDTLDGDSTNPSNPDDPTGGNVPNPDDLAGGDITQVDDTLDGDSTNPSNPDDPTGGDVPNPDDLAGGDITQSDDTLDGDSTNPSNPDDITGGDLTNLTGDLINTDDQIIGDVANNPDSDDLTGGDLTASSTLDDLSGGDLTNADDLTGGDITNPDDLTGDDDLTNPIDTIVEDTTIPNDLVDGDLTNQDDQTAGDLTNPDDPSDGDLTNPDDLTDGDLTTPSDVLDADSTDPNDITGGDVDDTTNPNGILAGGNTTNPDDLTSGDSTNPGDLTSGDSANPDDVTSGDILDSITTNNPNEGEVTNSDDTIFENTTIPDDLTGENIINSNDQPGEDLTTPTNPDDLTDGDAANPRNPADIYDADITNYIDANGNFRTDQFYYNNRF